MNRYRSITSLLQLTLALFIFGLSYADAQDKAASEAPAEPKRPVIIIPGVTGSTIVSSDTGKTVWFTFGFSRDEPDDLRLPITANLRANRDTLVASDIIREVKLPGILKVLPEIGVYGDALAGLRKAGYEEGDWNKPKASDVYYVFAYDWRRDNVESAQLLIHKIEALKAKLGRPDLKFDILAHSMGGLVANYAARFGAADLPARGTPRVTWAGARHINRILMFGVPNLGSFSAFEVLTRGYSIAGRKLPWVTDLGPDDVFSIPALYQLLPSGPDVKFFDGDLKPLKVDIFDAANWVRYRWGAIADPKFLGKLRDAGTIPGVKPIEWKKRNHDDELLAATTYRGASAFLAAALSRARQFSAAINGPVDSSPVEMLVYGSECEPTLNAAILMRNGKDDKWTTLTQPEKIKRPAGGEFSRDEVAKVMFASGDGRVTRDSLLPVVLSRPLFPVSIKFFACAEHQKLMNDQTIAGTYLALLTGRPAPASTQK
ncbi:MAG: lipase/acyltransferase domain-containing protein [Pyrinomonadaceae bacterium]